MPMDSGHMMSTLSMVGSAATMAATFYFWVTKFRRERPNLRIYPSDQSAEINLGVFRDAKRGFQFRLSGVIANYSSLPNAVLGVELAMIRRDGSWEEIPAPRAAGLPLNVPPMTTVRLDLEWSVQLPALDSAERLRANEIPRAYLEHYYAARRRIGIALWALGEAEFRAVLPLDSTRAESESSRWNVAA
jgi:hypothetical protein